MLYSFNIDKYQGISHTSKIRNVQFTSRDVLIDKTVMISVRLHF